MPVLNRKNEYSSSAGAIANGRTKKATFSAAVVSAAGRIYYSSDEERLTAKSVKPHAEVELPPSIRFLVDWQSTIPFIVLPQLVESPRSVE